MPGMEISLGFTGLDAAVRRMRELEQASGGVARNLRAAGGGTSAGPMARAAAAQQGLGAALAGGDPGAIFDAQVRALRAQQSVERAQRLLGGSSWGQRVSNLVSTTRFGGGGALGGAMPLVGRTAAAVGGEALAGPLGIAIAAVSAFAAVLNSATGAAGEFRRATTLTGGTAAQTAAIAAMGIAPGQQAGAAAGLREKLSTSGSAVMFAQRFLGIGPQMPRGFGGEVNEARLLELAQKRLRGLVDEGRVTEALIVARELNLEGMLDEAMVTRRLRDARDRDAAAQSKVFEANAQVFRDLESETTRAGMAISTLGVAIAGLAAPSVTEAAGNLADFVNRFRDFRQWQLDIVKNAPAWLGGGGGKGQTPEEKAAAAQEKNTEALDNNTRMMRDTMAGGGPLAQGALPAHARGPGAARAMELDRFKLGVFGN
jgi:hypothetical protein